jgi:hypothetical protein
VTEASCSLHPPAAACGFETLGASTAPLLDRSRRPAEPPLGAPEEEERPSPRMIGHAINRQSIGRAVCEVLQPLLGLLAPAAASAPTGGAAAAAAELVSCQQLGACEPPLRRVRVVEIMGWQEMWNRREISVGAHDDHTPVRRLNHSRRLAGLEELSLVPAGLLTPAGSVYAGRFHPWLSILAEIYLRHTWSCHDHEILRMETPGQAPRLRPGHALPR